MSDEITYADVKMGPTYTITPCAEGIRILVDEHREDVVGSSEWELVLLTWEWLDKKRATIATSQP